MVEVGSILEVSRGNHSAHFEWRLAGSEAERIGKGWWLVSPGVSFAGWEWQLFLAMEDSSGDKLHLRLRRWRQQSPAPVVRYSAGARTEGEGPEEEIGRGTMEGLLYYDSRSHPWLSVSELRRRRSEGPAPPSGNTISISLRLRTGPETEDEMKSLAGCEKAPSSLEVAAEKLTKTDLKGPETGGASGSASGLQETTPKDSEDDGMENPAASSRFMEKSTQTDSTDAQTNAEDASAKREESTQTDSEEAQTNVEDVCAKREEATQTDSEGSIPAPSLPATRTPSPRVEPPCAREEESESFGGVNRPEMFLAVSRAVGSVLEVSRSEEQSAHFEWRVPAPDAERLGRGAWLKSGPVDFAGRGWRLNLTTEDPSSGRLDLYLHRLHESSPAPVVHYRLEARKEDEGPQEEEIGRGTMGGDDRCSVPHPWLQLLQLRSTSGRPATSPGTFSIFVRLRTGSETDGEMERRAASDKSTQTDLKDFPKTGTRYRFVPIEAEDLLNIMSRQNK